MKAVEGEKTKLRLVELLSEHTRKSTKDVADAIERNNYMGVEEVRPASEKKVFKGVFKEVLQLPHNLHHSFPSGDGVWPDRQHCREDATHFRWKWVFQCPTRRENQQPQVYSSPRRPACCWHWGRQ
jgi:hypothetical protein